MAVIPNKWVEKKKEKKKPVESKQPEAFSTKCTKAVMHKTLSGVRK